MHLDVKMKAIARCTHWQLVQHHHVRKWHAPEVVEPNERLAQRVGEVVELRAREVGDARVRLSRRDVRLVRIAREVRNERQRLAAWTHENAPAIRFFGGQMMSLKSGASLWRPRCSEAAADSTSSVRKRKFVA